MLAPPEVACQLPLLVETNLDNASPVPTTYPTTERRHFLWMLGPVVELPPLFTKFVEHIERAWRSRGDGPPMAPQRVHGGVI